jgi:hypothetical protein
MDMDKVETGFIVGIVIVILVVFSSFVAKGSIKKDITQSCELSGHVVIRDKAYKCELID